MKYRDSGEVENDCPQCIAWKCEADRASLLLERLAEDFFPDQATFDEWMGKQMAQVFRAKL
jgi:hypothetical protein